MLPLSHQHAPRKEVPHRQIPSNKMAVDQSPLLSCAVCPNNRRQGYGAHTLLHPRPRGVGGKGHGMPERQLLLLVESVDEQAHNRCELGLEVVQEKAALLESTVKHMVGLSCLGVAATMYPGCSGSGPIVHPAALPQALSCFRLCKHASC
jgi:hypothetical protein